MSKLETAAQFISLMEDGKYENKINAQRGAGRTRLPESEKAKAFAAIDKFFGVEADASPVKKVGKKAAKKVAKKAAKKASKKVTAHPASTPAPAMESLPAAPAAPGKKAKKKATAKKKVAAASTKPPAGSLALSPTQVETVADVLKVIDSTVQQSVGIMNALQRADEINKSGDISEGVSIVKQALVGAAQLLQNSVVAPLRHAGTQADAEIAHRLEQVVNASSSPFQGDTGGLVPLPTQAPLATPPS